MKNLYFIFLFIFCLICDARVCPNTVKKQHEYKIYRHELSQEIDKYVQTYSNQTQLNTGKLIDLAEQYNIDIKFILAQSHIESHFGTKGLAKKTNSIFNVGAFDRLTYNQIHGNYKYENINESLEPYLKLLSTKYLVNNKTIYDLMDNFVDINNKRYASDKKYEKKLKSTYNKINNNTKIDSLYNLYIDAKNKLII